jgi:adenosylmethionine-8-amino-7-oxononanoate aminotransferase
MSDRLVLHFTRVGEPDVPLIVRGDGAYIEDAEGHRYLDALSGLFVGQVGHGREELAAAGARQAEQLAFFPLWGYAHPSASALAERIIELAPAGLDRVFFTSGGSEAVESAWKLVRSHFVLKGEPERHRVIARHGAYHGTTLGALSITGVDAIRDPFLPLLNGAVSHVTNTKDCWRGCDLACADEIEQAILRDGPETVAAVFLEPVQNAGGCLPPPPGYFQRVREICDRHGVLLVSDEVICGFGRLGAWFGAERLGYRPDLLTFAKGVTSGYAPLGGVLVGDHVLEPFRDGPASFAHGLTFGGHPVSCAVALANLDVMEREDLVARAAGHEAGLRAALASLEDRPLVHEARGMGAFFGVGLRREGEPLSPADAPAVISCLRKRIPQLGVYCRVDDRGEPAIMIAPPLIVGEEEHELIRVALRQALDDAWADLTDR